VGGGGVDGIPPPHTDDSKRKQADRRLNTWKEAGKRKEGELHQQKSLKQQPRGKKKKERRIGKNRERKLMGPVLTKSKREGGNSRG